MIPKNRIKIYNDQRFDDYTLILIIETWVSELDKNI